MPLFLYMYFRKFQSGVKVKIFVYITGLGGTSCLLDILLIALGIKKSGLAVCKEGRSSLQLAHTYKELGMCEVHVCLV